MPTARELLEQADALMRRDRSLAANGERARPSSTPITLTPRPLAGAATSPRTIQREPITPSAATPTDAPAPRESAGEPFVPAEAPSVLREPPSPLLGQPATPFGADRVEPVLARDATAAARVDDVPTLTETVVDAVASAGVDAAALADLSDDVPLLTDAVEAIEAESLDDLARGEPSVWDDASLGETSVLGPAPDSVVVVPPPGATSVGRDPLGLDQPAPGFVAPPSALAASDAPRPPDAEAAPDGRPTSEAAPAADADHVREDEMQQAHRDVGSRGTTGHGDLAAFSPLGPQPGYDAPVTLEWDDTGTSARLEDVTEVRVPPGPLAAAAEAAAAADGATAVVEASAAPALDEARLAEAVDEIRMQVLQRIDIFTDTTLRSKLGEHLQPLVERASADLVAAINQHVGDLLRTHVAEVLEQEIDRWREGQR